MKLYTTVTSNKTSKGIGDDKVLDIELKHGNKRIAKLCYTILNKEPYLDITIDNQVYEIALHR